MVGWNILDLKGEFAVFNEAEVFYVRMEIYLNLHIGQNKINMIVTLESTFGINLNWLISHLHSPCSTPIVLFF
jgi:hypothetical protein